MESRIRPTTEDQFGPILLVSEASSPSPADIIYLAGCEDLVVCDFYVQGCEVWSKESWGYSLNGICLVDHHAPDKRWERQISSTNLALNLVEAKGTSKLAVINHTDCDSILSAGIATGILKANPDYGSAAIAADHTGEVHPVAELLQAVSNERDLEFSFECLKLLENGLALPQRAMSLLRDRLSQRQLAKQVVMNKLVLNGRLACLQTETRIEGELISPLVPDAWVVAIAFPLESDLSRTEIKYRLTGSAPEGLSLHRLGIRRVAPAFGGRWNAGSNKRGGGTQKRPETIFDELGTCLKNFENERMLARAIQIGAIAHDGQFDKAGSPYFLHPLRVMSRCQNPLAKIAGVLHDVVEDCPEWNFDRLEEEGISSEVVEILKLLTHAAETNLDPYEDYMNYVARCGGHDAAREVKLADLEDNLDLSRLPEITLKDEKRLEKYWAARHLLLSFKHAPTLAIASAHQVPIRNRYNPNSLGNRKTSYTVKIEGGSFVDLATGLQLKLQDGSIAEMELKDKDVSNKNWLSCYAPSFDVEILKEGDRIYAGVKVRDLSEDLHAMLFDLDKLPVRRAKLNPNNPLEPVLSRPKSEVQLVEMVLLQDLILTSRNTKIPKLVGCRVKVPSLEEEFDSVNLAYSRISAVFEPWRKSTASNAFRTAYTAVKVEEPGDEPYWRLEPLDYLRAQVENVRHLMTKKQIYSTGAI